MLEASGCRSLPKAPSHHTTHTLLETNMETQKGPYKDYSPSQNGAIWVSMLVWGSVPGLWSSYRKHLTQDLRTLHALHALLDHPLQPSQPTFW